MVQTQSQALDERPVLWARRGGTWQAMTWHDLWQAVTALAGGLRALGLSPGGRVMLVSENRPEWVVADLAVMAAGGVTVPAYVTNTPADHLHILNNSGARFAIVSTRALAERLLPAALQAEHPPTIVAIETPRVAQTGEVSLVSWDQAMALGAGQEEVVAAAVRATQRGDTACIIYTSGTGGAPKGVMLSHGAILTNCRGAAQVLAAFGLGDEVFLSFLPLSHSYEHTAGLYFPLSIGAQIYYAEGIEQLAGNMAEIHPTLMTAVPRLYEMMRGRILAAVHRKGGMGGRLFARALALGTRRVERGRLGPAEALADRALDLLVRRKVAGRFGGRLKALISGGAPLAYDVGLFFAALGVRILQGYGQTEAAPVVSCNPPGRVRLDTVGPPLPGVEVRLAEDGEILVRGELVMRGYWGDAEATARAVDGEGWLHTGDVGEIDPDGYLRITDRKKDIIVNSGGDNISPQRVEGLLTLQPEIAQAWVSGDRRPHLVALLVPAEDFAKAWSRTHGRPATPDDADFRHAVAEAVNRVNRNVSTIEKIRRFTLAPEPFTVQNGQLTPTLKIRRHKLREAYGAAVDKLYEQRDQ